MTKESALNELIKDSNTDLISDGFHTFKELYEHRIVNFMTICKLLYDYEPYSKVPVWMTKKHSDGSSWDGWFVLGIHTEQGKQITYHLPIEKWDECDLFAKELPKAPDWDGHTSDDVLIRLKELV